MNSIKLLQICVVASIFAAMHVVMGAEPALAVERWTDSRLTMTRGLAVWLDASKLSDARKTASLMPLKDGDPVEVWPDGSGRQRDVVQKQAKQQPVYRPTGDFQAVRFEGQGIHLRISDLGQSFKDMTVFVVAAPYSNPEPFAALLSMSKAGRNDFETGLNIDQAVGRPQRFEVVNIEGAGSVGMKNLMQGPLPYGSVARLCVTSTPGKDGTVLWINGKRQGTRDRGDNSIVHMDELVIGARYYTLGGKPEVRGFGHGDIAEVLVFDHLLADADRTAVEKYLTEKYGSIAALPFPQAASNGKPLERVQNPPPVQVLIPGFAARQLPIDLPNINNVLYRPDGKLVALGYDGNVWLLSDTDGDGLEDNVAVYWENKGQIRAPIGMALTPPNGKHGAGAFVSSKGKCSLLVDTDGDDKADREVVVADGWKESPHGVDALGVAVDPQDGSVYFGLGTQDYTNAYVMGPDGVPAYSLKSERGTIMRVAPDFKSREVVATGIRFPVGLRFNQAGDLFCTDQEGATWLPNGNPLDELLHIQKGRHYGFPPRHPKHLPNVIDEPSTFDYGPQHQSTCGLCFNEPVKNGGPLFGPKEWAGDVFVTGYSRGKIYRTQLAKTPSGYVARNMVFASTSMLPADCCITPDGSLVIACHSGGPDWGSGPTGKGKLFKVTYSDREHPQPVLAWSAGQRELRVEFDRPVDPQLLRDVVARTEITAGKFVRAGDRFESLWPGYAVVQSQHLAPRLDVKVYSAQLTPDRRTLILATDPLRAAVHYELTLPGMGRPTKDSMPRGELAQAPQVDLDFDLSGIEAKWMQNGQVVWSGWLPSLDLAVSRRWTASSAHHDLLWTAMKTKGELILTTRLDLIDMLRPEVQPGSKLDYELPAEQVTVTFHSSSNAQVRVLDDSSSTSQAQNATTTNTIQLTPKRGQLATVEVRLTDISLADVATVSGSYSTNEDNRARSLQPHRALLPWAEIKADLGELNLVTLPKELVGGSWARGWKVFHNEKIGCAKCHTVHSKGAKIGPDLSNLIHRDYTSVMRDITLPSFAINPDYVASTLILTDGRVLTGVIRTDEDKLHVGDKTGLVTVINKSEVDEAQISQLSVMPDSLLKALSPEQTRDLLTFLLSPGPSMPREDIGIPRPKPRSVAEVNKILSGAPTPSEKARSLRVVLVAGPKDHGPGEHDYPAWLKAWSELLAVGDNLEVVTAMGWPEQSEFQKADVIVFYQRGDWDSRRAADIDAFRERGGGLVYIHWAVDGQKDAPGFAKRIALAWGNGARFRHGLLDLSFKSGISHPVTRGFNTLKLVDESYWNLTGDLPADRVLGSGVEDNQPQPLFWSLDQGPGRVFVSIPGHFPGPSTIRCIEY